MRASRSKYVKEASIVLFLRYIYIYVHTSLYAFMCVVYMCSADGTRAVVHIKAYH